MIFPSFVKNVDFAKFVLPSRRELNFYKIAVFDLDAKTHRTSSEEYLDFEVKIQENYGQNRFSKQTRHFLLELGRPQSLYENGGGPSSAIQHSY